MKSNGRKKIETCKTTNKSDESKKNQEREGMLDLSDILDMLSC